DKTWARVLECRATIKKALSASPASGQSFDLADTLSAQLSDQREGSRLPELRKIAHAYEDYQERREREKEVFWRASSRRETDRTVEKLNKLLDAPAIVKSYPFMKKADRIDRRLV